jgi:hypothetical protein
MIPRNHNENVRSLIRFQVRSYFISYFKVGLVAHNGNNYQTADNNELEEKNLSYANSTTQRCPKEIVNIFLI